MADRSERLRELYQGKDQPEPTEVVQEMGYFISKKTGPSVPCCSVTESSLRLNSALCTLCRRIFEDLGDPAPILTEAESGPFFMFYRVLELESSAASGCRLCLLVLRGLRARGSEEHWRQNLRSRYDYGEYMTKEGRIFALRFFFTVVAKPGQASEGGSLDSVVPRSISVTITLQKAEGLCLGAIEAVHSSNTGSRESIEFIKRWSRQCNVSHSSCKSQSILPSPFVPSRLLKVGVAGQDFISLRESNDINDPIHYLTLSHCWGQASLTKLVKASLPRYKQRISLTELNKTFREAVQLTRQLEVSYLWIDCLCIIQDSEEDWKREAARMWEVYSHSYLNLSATASTDSTQGLFRERLALEVQRCEVEVSESHARLKTGKYVCFDDTEWIREVDDGPVNCRAWVCQERLLSPRVAHFAESQIFWECHELLASESFPAGLPQRYQQSYHRQVLRSAKEPDSKDLRKLWNSIVKHYTSGRLSLRSDKLIAVSALARELLKIAPTMTENDYLAGIWRADLIYQLLWSATTETRSADIYRAPSWSWASVDGPVIPNMEWKEVGRSGRYEDFRLMAEILSATVDFSDNMLDLVSGGLLRVSAPLLPVSLVLGRVDDGHGEGRLIESAEDSRLLYAFCEDIGGFWWDNVHWTRGQEPKLPLRDFIVDFPEDNYAGVGRLDNEKNEQRIKNVFFLPLLCVQQCAFRNRDPIEIESIHGLIIEPTEDKVGQFRRIGTCRWESENAVMEFLRRLGLRNDIVERTLQSSRPIKLEDFAFEGYKPPKPQKELPEEYPRYEIEII